MKRVFEKCPNCDADLSESLFMYFQGGDCSMNFEYQCPHCSAIIDVEVEAVPQFFCALAERPNTASRPTALAAVQNENHALPAQRLKHGRWADLGGSDDTR